MTWEGRLTRKLLDTIETSVKEKALPPLVKEYYVLKTPTDLSPEGGKCVGICVCPHWGLNHTAI